MRNEPLDIYTVGPIARDSDGAPLRPSIAGRIYTGPLELLRSDGASNEYRAGPYTWSVARLSGRVSQFEHAGVVLIRFALGGRHALEVWTPLAAGRWIVRSWPSRGAEWRTLDHKRREHGDKSFVDARGVRHRMMRIRGRSYGRVVSDNRLSFAWSDERVPADYCERQRPKPTDLQRTLRISPAVSRHICEFV